MNYHKNLFIYALDNFKNKSIQTIIILPSTISMSFKVEIFILYEQYKK
jgi:hypothetical protein